MMERVALSAGRCGSECVEYSITYVTYLFLRLCYTDLTDTERDILWAVII